MRNQSNHKVHVHSIHTIRRLYVALFLEVDIGIHIFMEKKIPAELIDACQEVHCRRSEVGIEKQEHLRDQAAIHSQYIKSAFLFCIEVAK